MHTDCDRWVVEIDKKDIAYVVGIFESYDDFGVVRTLEAERGHIEIMASPDYAEEIRILLENLALEIPLKVLSSS